jgi:hypothetical protein
VNLLSPKKRKKERKKKNPENKVKQTAQAAPWKELCVIRCLV